MLPDESLSDATERLWPFLNLVYERLSEAVVLTSAHHVANGLVESADPAFMCAFVRRTLRQSLTVDYPMLAEKNGNMSAIHLDLNHEQFKVLHAREGDVPPAESDARLQYYGINDAPQGVLDYTDASCDGFVKTAFVIVWDAQDGKVTKFSLCRPHGDGRVAEQVDFLALRNQVEPEDDINIEKIEVDRRGEKKAVGGISTIDPGQIGERHRYSRRNDEDK
ncbi:MAG: hypothetical protein WC864_05670 [Ilumatobacteraceae bacterium]